MLFFQYLYRSQILLIEASQTKILEAWLGLDTTSGFQKVDMRRSIFDILMDTIFMDGCIHDPDSALEAPELSAVFVSPLDNTLDPNQADRIFVFTVNRREDLRLLSLTGRDGPFVLKNNACLRCSTDMCMKSGYKYLIL